MFESNSETKDPFKGYFDKNTAWAPDKDSLLDIPLARRWMKAVEWSIDYGVYTYQQALESKSGPQTMLKNEVFTMLSSYDYLGLIGHPDIEKAAIDAIQTFGTGTGGVRLLTGTNELHEELESSIASMKRKEACITFSSGYLANLGAISALFNNRDVIIADEYVHRSLIDGIRLSGVPYELFKHNSLDHLEELLIERHSDRRRLILVEGTYSMDGDICPLPEIRRIKAKIRSVSDG